MKDKSYRRHIAKSVTWRTVGTIDTFLLAWLISGDPFTGLKIGVAEVITKMILYYLHERFWFRIRSNGVNSQKRHLAKAVTWRIIGTMDTMALAWIISGDAMTGLKIGVAEVITKMILYYFHERIWYRSDYGLAHRNANEPKEGKSRAEL